MTVVAIYMNTTMKFLLMITVNCYLGKLIKIQRRYFTNSQLDEYSV